MGSYPITRDTLFDLAVCNEECPFLKVEYDRDYDDSDGYCYAYDSTDKDVGNITFTELSPISKYSNKYIRCDGCINNSEKTSEI
jgi:hypothetical protein